MVGPVAVSHEGTGATRAQHAAAAEYSSWTEGSRNRLAPADKTSLPPIHLEMRFVAMHTPYPEPKPNLVLVNRTPARTAAICILAPIDRYHSWERFTEGSGLLWGERPRATNVLGAFMAGGRLGGDCPGKPRRA